MSERPDKVVINDITYTASEGGGYTSQSGSSISDRTAMDHNGFQLMMQITFEQQEAAEQYKREHGKYPDGWDETPIEEKIRKLGDTFHGTSSSSTSLGGILLVAGGVMLASAIIGTSGSNTETRTVKNSQETHQREKYPAMSITIAEDGKFRRSLSDTGNLAKDNALNWCTHMDKQKNCVTVLTIDERKGYCIAIAKDFTNRGRPIYEKFYNIEGETLSKRRLTSVNQRVMEIGHVSYFCNTNDLQERLRSLSDRMNELTAQRTERDQKAQADEVRKAFESVTKMPPPVRTPNPPGNQTYVLRNDVPLRVAPQIGVESTTLPSGTCITVLDNRTHERFSKVLVPSLNKEGWMPKGTFFPAPDCGAKGATGNAVAPKPKPPNNTAMNGPFTVNRDSSLWTQAWDRREPSANFREAAVGTYSPLQENTCMNIVEYQPGRTLAKVRLHGSDEEGWVEAKLLRPAPQCPLG